MNLNLLQSLIVDEGGQSATEYAILLGWISLSLILTLSAIGTRVHGVFDNMARQLDQLPVYS